MIKEINLITAVKISQEWLRNNITRNLFNSNYTPIIMNSPNKEKDYFLIVCSLILDIGKEETFYVFLINKDGSIKKIGEGERAEENTIKIKELKLEWIK